VAVFKEVPVMLDLSPKQKKWIVTMKMERTRRIWMIRTWKVWMIQMRRILVKVG